MSSHSKPKRWAALALSFSDDPYRIVEAKSDKVFVIENYNKLNTKQFIHNILSTIRHSFPQGKYRFNFVNNWSTQYTQNRSWKSSWTFALMSNMKFLFFAKSYKMAKTWRRSPYRSCGEMCLGLWRTSCTPQESSIKNDECRQRFVNSILSGNCHEECNPHVLDHSKFREISSLCSITVYLFNKVLSVMCYKLFHWY